MEDWEYLMHALMNGGSCAVKCPAVRASLTAAGLMEPARGFSGNSWSNYGMAKAMTLTKKGQRRAREVLAQDSTPYNRRMDRRAKNMALAKVKRTRH